MDDLPGTELTASAAERYRALLEINNAVISNLTQDALFHAIAGALRRMVSFERTAMFLHDPDRDVLRLFVLESSLPSTYFHVGLEMAPGESHVGRVFREGRSLLRRDLEREREYPMEDRALADGVRSYVMVPLVVRGTTVGTLAVASTTANRYGEEDAVFLQEAAGQIALAIANMQAHERISALSARVASAAERYRLLLDVNDAVVSNLTRDALFEAIAGALRRLVPYERIAVFLHDPARDALRLTVLESTLATQHFVVGWEQASLDSPAGWVRRHRQPLVRQDLTQERPYRADELSHADGVRSYVIVPLLAGDQAIGVLTVASAAPDRYGEAEVQLLREVANQVAPAVANMQAYEEIAALKTRLQRESVYLQEEIRREHNFVEMVGTSPALVAALRKVEQVAARDSTVLIFGETGTGKELIARAIHDRSPRRDRPLVKVNCSALSAGLVESELFGHVKGAFTGALDRRIGRFELADGGTIFLDEVGELPLDTQVKLLRVLQEQEFEPVGSSRTVRVDVRIIAASNRDLEEAVRAGRFRADLFYRLNVFPIAVPALRDRRSDIPLLAMFFLERFSRRFGKVLDAVSQETMDRLVSYAWPGNVRELQNIIERAAVLSDGRVLELDRNLLPVSGATAARHGVEVGEPPGAPARPTDPGLPSLEDMERAHIRAALARTGGVVEGPTGAARLLRLHPNTLRSRMKKLGIDRRSHEMS